jgi:uncharacterized membrane protein YfcA
MPDIALLIVTTAAAFLVAGFVKGVVGLGLPTVAIALLGLVMTPAEAAALLVLPTFVTNVWQLAAGPRLHALMQRLWPMLLGIAIGTLAGPALLTGGAGHQATIALGLALIVYALWGLSEMRLRVPDRAEQWLSPLVGAATGVVTAATGVFVLPSVPYLQALDLDKDDLVQAMGLSFTVSTLALAATLVRDNAFQPALAAASLAALLPALGGMAGGQWIRARVEPSTFCICFFLGLLALGGHLASNAVL